MDRIVDLILPSAASIIACAGLAVLPRYPVPQLSCAGADSRRHRSRHHHAHSVAQLHLPLSSLRPVTMPHGAITHRKGGYGPGLDGGNPSLSAYRSTRRRYCEFTVYPECDQLLCICSVSGSTTNTTKRWARLQPWCTQMRQWSASTGRPINPADQILPIIWDLYFAQLDFALGYFASICAR